MVATTGNTLPPPPRLTGNTPADLVSLQSWMNDLYQALGLEANVVGTQEQHTTDIAANTAAIDLLGGRVQKVETAAQGVADLAYLEGPISGVYDPTQLEAAFDKINAIIEKTREGVTS